MSEEEQQPEAEELVEDTTVGDTLVDALFSASQDEEESSDDRGDALSLNETLDYLGEEPESNEEEVQDTQDVQEETEPVSEAQPQQKKKVRRIVKKEVVDPVVKEAPVEAAQPIEQQPDPVDPFIDELTDSERDVYQLASYAENRQGKEGLSKKYLEFFKSNKEYLEKRAQEDPHFDASADEDYRSFVARNNPKFSPKDMKDAREGMLIDKAEDRAMQRVQPVIDDLRRQQYISEVTPRVNAAKQNFTRHILSAAPEELHPLIKEKGMEELAKQHPLEYDALRAVAGEYQGMANYLIEIGARLRPEINAPNYQPPVEGQKLDRWIDAQQSAFIKSGASNTQRDGKTFARRENFVELDRQSPGKYWTWGDGDLLQLLVGSAKVRVKDIVGAEREKHSRYNGQPAPQQATTTPEPTPKRAAPSPRPGGIPQEQKTEDKNAMLSVLGM